MTGHRVLVVRLPAGTARAEELPEIAEYVSRALIDGVLVLTERPEQQNPCDGCSDGWGTAATTGVHTCHETCDRLKAYMEAGKDGR